MSLMDRRLVYKMARAVTVEMFGINPPEIELRFVKNSPRRVLRAGFRRLVPDRTERRVVIHVRHERRRRGHHGMIDFFAHELMHAKHILEGRLVQERRGAIRFDGERFVFRYRIDCRLYVVTREKTFVPERYVPWERFLVAEGRHALNAYRKLFPKVSGEMADKG